MARSSVGNIHLTDKAMHVGLRGFTDIKIEAYLSYNATWRGSNVVVRVTADRYTMNEGELSPWRVVIDRAREGTDLWGGRGITETASTRLLEVLKPDALDWLTTQAADRLLQTDYFDACVRELKNTSPWDINKSRADDLYTYFGPDMGDHRDSFREFVVAYKAWIDACENVTNY